MRESELAELRALVEEETRPQREESARSYLRRQAEHHADLLWHAFQDGLTALRSDGSVDFRIRLEAGREPVGAPGRCLPVRQYGRPKEAARQQPSREWIHMISEHPR